MALNLVPSHRPSPAVASSGPAIELLARLARASERAGDLATFAGEVAPEIQAAVELARRLGLADEAVVLGSFATRTAVDTPSFRGWAPPQAPFVSMAARSILARLVEAGEGEEGLGAIDALAAGLMRSAPVEALVYDGLDLGEVPDSLSALLQVATQRATNLTRFESGFRHGGLWARTHIAPQDLEALHAQLAELGAQKIRLPDSETDHFPSQFAQGVRIPDTIEWRTSRHFPGIAHGTPLRLVNDPGDGTVIIPIQMAAGSRYPEHLHVDDEHVLFLPGSGPIVDLGRTFKKSADYRMPPGSVHTPTVPLDGPPALFLGIAKRGVVLTPFGTGTRGAELVTLAGAKAPDLARLFAELPPDNPVQKQTPRADFARAFWGDLDFLARRESVEIDYYRRPAEEGGDPVWENLIRNSRLPSPADLFQMLLGMKPDERVAWARGTHFKANVLRGG